MSTPEGAPNHAVEVVPEALADERLDRLVALITGCSRAEAVEAIRSGGVLVDGHVATKPSLRVSTGAEVSIAEDPVAADEVVEPDEDVLEDGVAFAGVAKFPARVKCALLGWMAWKDATSQVVASNGNQENR